MVICSIIDGKTTCIPPITFNEIVLFGQTTESELTTPEGLEELFFIIKFSVTTLSQPELFVKV